MEDDKLERSSADIDAIKDDLGAFKDAIKDDLGAFKDAIKDDLGAFKDAIKDDLGAFKDAFKDDFGAFKDAIKGLLESIFPEMAQRKNGNNRLLNIQRPPLDWGKGMQVHHRGESNTGPPLPMSLPTEGKKYRLHIVGQVYNHEVTNGNIKIRNVISGEPLRVKVILKDVHRQPVPGDDMRVEIVVLDGDYYIADSTNWSQEEFAEHFMVESKDKKKMVSKGSNTATDSRVKVQQGIFSLEPEKPFQTVFINQTTEKNTKVKLGVMVYQGERVLEGVSTNNFNVIAKLRYKPSFDCDGIFHEKKDNVREGSSELNPNGKRIKQPSNSDPQSHHPGTGGFNLGAPALIAPPQAFGPDSNQGPPAPGMTGPLGDLPMLGSTADHVTNPLSQNQMTGSYGTGGGQGQHATQPPNQDVLVANPQVSTSPTTGPFTNPQHQGTMQRTNYDTAGAHHGNPTTLGCVPNGNNSDVLEGIWTPPNANFLPNLKLLEGQLLGFKWAQQEKEYQGQDKTTELMRTIAAIHGDVLPSVSQPYGLVKLRFDIETLFGELCVLATHIIMISNIEARLVPPVARGQSSGAPGNVGPSGGQSSGGNAIAGIDSHTMDVRSSVPPSGPSYSHPPPAAGAPGGDQHGYYAPGMAGQGGSGWQQTTLSKPSYAWTPNSHWTSGSSPAYLGQANGSNRNFLDQQYSEGYSVVPGEYDSAYAAGEQIEDTYRPHGYGNQGVVVRTSRPAVLRRRHQQKLARTPCLYTTPISSSDPFGYLITDYYHGAMSMVGMSHQQAMDNKVLMIEYWKLLVRSHAAVRRISRQQAMDEIVGRLGISTSCLTTGVKKKKKTEIEVIVEPKQQQVKSQAEAASLGDDKKNRSFVVLDLKATCWDRNNKDKDRLFGRQDSEIIEFSSVLVDAATGDTEPDIFHEYVIPTENHVLTEYCMIYNGIRQGDVERDNGAVMLWEALRLHREWIGKLTNWNSTAVVVTWGDWDCRTMLKQECFRKNLHVPDYFTRWINLKAPFAEKYGGGFWKKTVKDALEATKELKWEGPITGGRSHALNKARLLSLLIGQGANLDITGCLVPKKCI